MTRSLRGLTECNNFTYGDVERLLMVSNRIRWVFCQLEALQDCLPSSVRRTLAELPESLDETYERILREIKRPSRDHARRLLQCLVVAIRPLRVEELAELLAYDFDATEGGIPKVNPNWRWEDHEQAVLSTCSSLIAVVRDGRHRVVQFSHFSVKEFLTSSRLAISGGDVAHHCISLELAHTLLAQACLGTLLSLDDNAGSDGSSFLLAEYAARYWVAHAQVDNVSQRVQAGMQQLFDPSKTHLASWIKLDNPDDYSDRIEVPLIDPIAASLYYAALCGFRGVVEHLLIKYPGHVDAFGGGRGAPLHVASSLNRMEVAQILLERGGDTDVRGNLKQAPLHFAAMKGHLEMVRLLIDHGAEVDSRREDLWTPLHLAAWNGYADISQTLLEHKASTRRPQFLGTIGAGFHCTGYQDTQVRDVTIRALCRYYWNMVRMWKKQMKKVQRRCTWHHPMRKQRLFASYSTMVRM